MANISHSKQFLFFKTHFCLNASINSSGAHPPPGQPWGICQCCQSRGWGIRNFIAARGLGISIPRGESRAFDTRVFELTWRSLSGRTKPLWKTGLSVTDLKNLWKFLKVCFIYIYIHFFLCTLVLGSTNIFYHISVKLSVSFLFT